MRTTEYLQSLVRELAKLSAETEWVEFKCNNKDPDRIAKYISGLSNAATLWEKPKAYLVWGIENETHNIIGTTFDYRKMQKGGEELEAWLTRMVNPKINFRFYEVEMEENLKVVLIEIPCAEIEPTKYGTTPYIRIGSSLKPLIEYKDKEAELWRLFDTRPFELRVAISDVEENEIIRLLEYIQYYEKLELPIPKNLNKIYEDFAKEKFIKKNDAGNWDISNLGALILAKDLKRFDSLARKTIRVIWYKNNTRLEAYQEREFRSGYLNSYENIISYIMTIIPQEEVITDGIRKVKISFPEIAIRELLANIMIHQALEQRGTNPMIEIFSDRIEFSNAGAPLVAIERIVDTVPVSRNENIAGFMHRCGICEERGSGYDKVVDATSKNTLLAPKIENQNNQFTKVVLFAKIPFNLTSKEDRIRTCYMQACLAYVNFSAITNSDVRQVFGLEESEKVKSSRIIKDTFEAGLIKPVDPETAPRYMKYIPHWA